MSERIVGDAKDLIVYPPDVMPEPYVLPWLRERQKPEDK